MPNTGFTINGTELTANWPDKTYLLNRYPELSNILKTSGLWVAGIGSNGYLGNNATGRISSPVQTVAGGNNWKLMSAGFYIASGIKTDGTLWTWGLNTNGALGTNNTVSQSSPVQTVSSGTNWKLVSSGSYNLAALKTDGTLWLWGRNHRGQLGDNTITNKSSPVQTVSGGTNWKFIGSGQYHTAAIKTDGRLWTWGDNGSGQLGDNTGINRSSPIQTVSGGTNWKQVSSGGYSTFAIKTDGTLWTWGENGFGQLATNTVVSPIRSPVQTVSGGTNWRQVSGGTFGALATKTDGTLWGWGWNTIGQLADGTTTPRSSPVQTVAGGTNWLVVDHHISNSGVALKTDGTVWLWGQNAYGQLGDNTRTSYSSPVQNISGGSNWKSVSANWGQVMLIRDNASDPL